MTVTDPPTSIPAVTARSRSSFLISLSCVIALLYFGRPFFITLLGAVIISFILEPAVGFFMRLRLPRGLASFVVCSLALAVVYLVGLGVYTQISILLDELPAYGQRINDISDTVFSQIENMEKTAYQVLVPKRIQEKDRIQDQPPAPQPPQQRRRSAVPPTPPPVQEVRIRSERPLLSESLYKYLPSVASILLMASFVPFLVYFMLSWRDHLRRSFLAMFEGDSRAMAGATLHGIANMARAYVVGNFLLGVLLAVGSTVFFYFVRIPYFLIVGPLSGFLSLVPYIGLPLAIIPPFAAALTVYTKVTAYLIIGTTVAFFHLIALNLLYPKLVGSRVHLNPLAVTVALMFWGFLWGGVGLVLAIPITAGFKAFCDNVESFETYGKLLGD